VLPESPPEFLDVPDQMMKTVGAGVAVGRNVWQRPRREAAGISKEIIARVRA
jgi:DhnA family fructose-bisphosphate aldolase class Ia